MGIVRSHPRKNGKKWCHFSVVHFLAALEKKELTRMPLS
jgi:hypothetical protein